jgi:hypothetical protein
MKILSFAIISCLFVTSEACNKETTVPVQTRDKKEAVIVIKDCTGTYLTVGGKDFQVCNLEKTASFAHNTSATATFSKIVLCKGAANNAISCKMLHANEGWIEIQTIQ